MPITEKIAIIGLGYVGLPIALAFARQKIDVTGFDINTKRIADLKAGYDQTGEADIDDLKSTTLKLTDQADDIKNATVFIVTVPTPVDSNNQPDLTPLEKASKTIGPLIKKGDIVVYESTVYPGVTEDFCGPILEQYSGLKSGIDFFLGYSPERINPGDKVHRFEKITKVIAGQTPEALQRIENVYGAVVEAGLFRAASIKVAEAAKVIENTQRDINIALMNELAMIFDKLGIRTKDVLEAAGTKWNFLPFTPGLVGGHCIGVDPYYLTTCAKAVGHHPEVILSGRTTNNNVSAFLTQKMLELLARSGTQNTKSRIGILGITFKENVPDLRNTKVVEIYNGLKAHGIETLIHDPVALPHDAMGYYNIQLDHLDSFKDLDGLIIAVSHEFYKKLGLEKLLSMVKQGGVIIDVKSIFKPQDIKQHLYWSL